MVIISPRILYGYFVWAILWPSVNHLWLALIILISHISANSIHIKQLWMSIKPCQKYFIKNSTFCLTIFLAIEIKISFNLNISNEFQSCLCHSCQILRFCQHFEFWVYRHISYAWVLSIRPFQAKIYGNTIIVRQFSWQIHGKIFVWQLNCCTLKLISFINVFVLLFQFVFGLFITYSRISYFMVYFEIIWYMKAAIKVASE